MIVEGCEFLLIITDLSAKEEMKVFSLRSLYNNQANSERNVLYRF